MNSLPHNVVYVWCTPNDVPIVGLFLNLSRITSTYVRSDVSECNFFFFLFNQHIIILILIYKNKNNQNIIMTHLSLDKLSLIYNSTNLFFSSWDECSPISYCTLYGEHIFYHNLWISPQKDPIKPSNPFAVVILG